MSYWEQQLEYNKLSKPYRISINDLLVKYFQRIDGLGLEYGDGKNAKKASKTNIRKTDIPDPSDRWEMIYGYGMSPSNRSNNRIHRSQRLHRLPSMVSTTTTSSSTTSMSNISILNEMEAVKKFTKMKREWTERAIEDQKKKYDKLFPCGEPGTLICFNEELKYFRDTAATKDSEKGNRPYSMGVYIFGSGSDSKKKGKVAGVKKRTKLRRRRTFGIGGTTQVGDIGIILSDKILSEAIIMDEKRWNGEVVFIREIEVLLTQHQHSVEGTIRNVKGILYCSPHNRYTIFSSEVSAGNHNPRETR